MIVPRVDKKVPRDDKDKYIARAIEMFREELRRSEKEPVEFHGHFSEKELPTDDKAEYRAWLIEILREQRRRYEKVPGEFHSHFSEKELATPSDSKKTPEKEHTPVDGADDTPVSEEKKLSHDKKRKSTVLSPQHISSVKKSKKEKNKNKNKEYEKEEKTKIKKISCTTMLALVDRFVNEKTSSFEMKLKNMERLLNQHLDEDNKVGPVPVYVTRLV